MTDTEKLNQDIIKCSLSVKSLIQDIQNCNGPLEKLNELNASGRSKLSYLREMIDELESYGKETFDNDLMEEARNYREQYYNTFSMFRKANVNCMLAIEKANKEELFKMDESSTVRQRLLSLVILLFFLIFFKSKVNIIMNFRIKKDKANMVKMSSNVTDQLLSISRHLADTTQLSADTLQTLANSSMTVTGTSGELHETKSAISQSGKLLDKYSRRQFTDKLILLLGFAFFLACVLYILKKRLL
ncbi:vesicle transport protein SEC20 isoform X1 [Halyomorpha halys]|uniref:vesicle transport protein SEC20 isoform X1 n=1 Tax=Halyomorpha halys TaxID=286706 RepID=UPI000D0C8809|nr:vesicle transport protein SEC20 isoform X2 [Halyomorpha halys]